MELLQSAPFFSIPPSHGKWSIIKSCLKGAAHYITCSWAYPSPLKVRPHLQWKVERYEDLLKEAQKEMHAYLHDLPTDEQRSAEWEMQVAPLIEFCDKQVRTGDDRFSLDYLAALRYAHRKELIGTLRQMVARAEKNADDPSAKHVYALCHIFYTKINLNERCQAVWQHFVKKEEALPQDNLEEELRAIHRQIQQAPTRLKLPRIKRCWQTMLGHLNGLFKKFSFDPNTNSNPIHVLYKKQWKVKGTNGETLFKESQDIAMGTPTIELGNGKAEINPEFKGFIKHYQNTGQCHLYVNHQNYISRSRLKGNEHPRSHALHQFAQQSGGALVVLTLSQNSHFYDQANPKRESAERFKRELIEQLFEKESRETGNYLPDQYKKELTEWGKGAIEAIHANLFEGAEELTQEERKVFIRICYQTLTRKLLLLCKANTYNMSCKDRIDRGAASDAEDFAYLALLNDSFDQSITRDFFNTMIFARAIIVRKRSIKLERLERLITTILMLLRKQEQLKQLEKVLFPDIEMTIDLFNK